MLTVKSRIRDIYANPIGRDIIKKILLQTGWDEWVITNSLVGRVPLEWIPTLTMGKLDRGFLDTLIELLNIEQGAQGAESEAARAAAASSAAAAASSGAGQHPAWWKEAVFYQIYPRSFNDSNGDGIGDLQGIIQKLDYLKQLGVDAIWLSPIYDSPNDDNGYDIRDYQKIMAEFGTMEDFDRLLEGVHARGMRLIMDLVVNHTSDEHEWYQRAVHDPTSKYGDYYIFRDKPNNWTSHFSGSAWNFVEERGQYALHLFSKKQVDLNWENPAVREEIIRMVGWWLGKGVDGFRMDVVNFISKRTGLPDGNLMIRRMMGSCGVEHYFYGPRLHEYLKELNKKAFEPYGAFTVGETPGVGMEMSKLLTAPGRQELDMVFSFDHLETPGHTKFDDYAYDLNFYKKIMIDLMEGYAKECQISLFYDNHDNPRMISKVNPDPQYRDVLAGLLAVMQLTLKGTPFIYQGQEMATTNVNFSSMDELRDVESINLYAELRKTMSEDQAFKRILAGTRDHARAMIDWNGVEPAGSGFRSFRLYRRLIALRKAHRALVYGDIEIVNKGIKDLFTYYRSSREEKFYIECNLDKGMLQRKSGLPRGELLLSNYADESGKPTAPSTTLRPYEANIWKIQKD